MIYFELELDGILMLITTIEQNAPLMDMCRCSVSQKIANRLENNLVVFQKLNCNIIGLT